MTTPKDFYQGGTRQPYRLSDVLYLLARYEENKAGKKSRHPSY